MDMQYVITLGRAAIYTTLLVAAPMLVLSLIVGLIIAILQGVTQIQEMTLTFVPKLFGVVAVLAVGGPWMLAQLVAFASSIYNSFPTYVH